MIYINDGWLQGKKLGRSHELKGQDMTTGEILYICLATGAPTVFAVTLAYLSWEFSRYHKG